MAKLIIHHKRCTGCGVCATACPFGTMEIVGGSASITAGCRMCSVCLKQCPEGAISLEESTVQMTDRTDWNGIMVFGECTAAGIHPVTFELIGKAQELAEAVPQPLFCVLIGPDAVQHAESLRGYGLREVYGFGEARFAGFLAHECADALSEAIEALQPGIVLVGATAIGRSLAPRVATRFQTGLTADCTALEIRPNGDLVQIRPAFGGDIMAQILTPNTRPQMATVRHKVMSPAVSVTSVDTVIHSATVHASPLGGQVLACAPKPDVHSITDAEMLVVAGRGIKNKGDLFLLQELADALGGKLAATRPIIEAGWLPYTHQIGLSGRTVRPRLIIACGVSGAVQFTACMRDSGYIVAINTDSTAPIFNVAHLGLTGDLYQIIPRLMQRLMARKAGDIHGL